MFRVRFEAQQAFGQGDELRRAALRLPDHAAIGQLADNAAGQGAAEGLHPVAGLKIGAFAQTLDDFQHGLVIEHAGDVVGDGRGGFAAAGGGEIGKNEISNRAPDICEGIAVKKEKRRAAVTGAEEFEGFRETQGLLLFVEPLCFERSIAL